MYTDQCHEASEAFWQEFRWLVRRTLDKVPEEDELDLRYNIGDATSVFHCGIPVRGETIRTEAVRKLRQLGWTVFCDEEEKDA